MSDHKKQLKGWLDKWGDSSKDRKGDKQSVTFSFLSDCCGKAYSIIATVKLCIVAGDEVGSQNPDGTCRWWHIQAPEGDSADIPFHLWLLEPQMNILKSN